MKDVILKVLQETHDDGMVVERLADIADKLADVVLDRLCLSEILINGLGAVCHKANERWWHDPATGKRVNGILANC